jgi:signal transduction histidine kinase
MRLDCRSHRRCGRRRFAHSLSGRLILIFIGMGLLFLVLVGGTIGVGFRDHFLATVRPHLIQYLDYVQSDIGTPPNYARATELSRRLPVTIQIDGPDGSWASDGRPVALDGANVFHHARKGGKQFAYGELDGREYLITQNGGYTYAFSVPRDRSGWHVAVPLLVLLVVLVLLFHATRRLFAPIQAIKAGVERIGDGELDYRIQVSRSDELGDLAQSINAMATDVQRMLDSKRQLLLAISHELRSPLTRAKVATNLVEDESQRGEIERELNDLEKLVEELLETERLASRHQAVHKQRTNLNDLVREVAENLRGATTPALDLPPEPVEADVDAARIKLLVRNLLENALRYTPPGAPAPQLQLRRVTDGIELTVRDFGPGIAPEHLPHVTEPFYRADPARRRETGGYGLGLYLCRRIAEVHGGSLDVSSESPGGTRVCVQLPE